MQIPVKSNDQFLQNLTEKSEKIRSKFLEKITLSTKSRPIKVMLGDSTIIEQNTFDPQEVKQFYQTLLQHISNWKSEGVSLVNDKDLRRIFFKIEAQEKNYVLSCIMSLQFHALLYYKPDKRVIEIQNELSEIIDKTANLEFKISEQGDRIIQKKLKEFGHENADQQKLFEIFFQNDELFNSLSSKIYSKADKKFQLLTKKKSDLFKELDSLLIEVYHTSQILIDEIRMIAAEEGGLCHFNLEHIKNGNKEGDFEINKIPVRIKEWINSRVDEVLNSFYQ